MILPLNTRGVLPVAAAGRSFTATTTTRVAPATSEWYRRWRWRGFNVFFAEILNNKKVEHASCKRQQQQQQQLTYFK